MFTGIIEELGVVLAPAPRLRVGCKTVLEDLSQGASIAVNGVCLTAIEISADSFAADLAPETLRRSNLRDLTAGSRVNLERPVTPATRLSGHLVQGHVDATGELVSLEPLRDGNYWLKIRVPASLERYLVEKGSIAIDGISLTIAGLEGGVVSVTIIPHTFANTTLGFARAGARLNLEADIIAKHVEKLLNRQ
ncbi:MAG TPA: riboflavin synthase [Bryobacteraceae bacterium]|nr:riboflavin synthase [Bryobacteraceae bacterium]